MEILKLVKNWMRVKNIDQIEAYFNPSEVYYTLSERQILELIKDFKNTDNL